MNTVKYQVTNMVGTFERGDIIDVQLFIQGSENEAVIIHPEEDFFSCCLEIVVKGSDGIYRSKSEDSWISLPQDWEK